MDKILFDKYGKPIKIALIGGARTGKDTIAKYLGVAYSFKRLAFGDKLKEFLYKAIPDLPTDPKPREAYITYGQLMRSIDPLVWVKWLDRECNLNKEIGYENFVITDVRQPNEVEYCIDNGYILVKVVAPREVQEERALKGGEVLDVDNELDKLALSFGGFDYVIENNGTKQDLFRKIEEVIEKAKN